MIVRKLNQNHDWTFGKSNSEYLIESNAIKQCVLTAVLAVRNDWFLSMGDGVDWVNYLSRSTNMALFENDLKSNILAVDGVYSILSIVPVLDRNKRKATISIEYMDIFNNRITVNTNVDS